MFKIDTNLLTHARNALAGRARLYWLVGGAGAGKTTVCNALAAQFSLPVYDMDAQIYGAYHACFTPERHPVNSAWAAAPDGMAWLLALTAEEFAGFNQAALVEYLDLLAADLAGSDPHAPLLVDGGICNPGLLAQVIAPQQIVCLAGPQRSSAAIWATEERRAMQTFVEQLPQGPAAWQKFLAFDTQITQTIVHESQAAGISICVRDATEPVAAVTARVAAAFGLQKTLKM